MENAADILANARTSPTPLPGVGEASCGQTQKKRLSRAKRCVLWEQAVADSGGRYESNLREIARAFPCLSPAELRIAALVKAGLASRRIGEILAIKEESVERERVRIREKTGIRNTRQSLQVALLVI